MKKIHTLAAACLVATTALAGPAHPGTFNVQQKDGTTLTLQCVGDEHFHFYREVTTGAQYERTEDGDYRVLSSDTFARLSEAAALRRQQANLRRVERLQHNVHPATVAGPHRAAAPAKTLYTGQRKGLVILVNFADKTHVLDNPQQKWDDAFNKVDYHDNGHVGSVRDYFHDQSYGQFELDFDVVGPVTVSKGYAYYGKNINGYDAVAHEMIYEACVLADEFVNYADYDWNGDGEVDQVFVVYAGYEGGGEGSDPDCIWPHEWSLTAAGSPTLVLDGVQVDIYACASELSGVSGTVQSGIGSACHEFSHCLGFPDFYDTKYSGHYGMYLWDLLDAGSYGGPGLDSTVPVGYSAYERWAAGWLTPIEITEGTTVEAMPCLADEPVAYILRNKNRGTAQKPIDEYFLLENRQNKKWYSYPQNAHGLLVTHVDYDEESWIMNTVNVYQQRLSVVPAGLEYNYKLDGFGTMTFPGTKNVTRLTDVSHYGCGGKLFNRNTDGTYYLGLPLTDIAEDPTTGTISFDVLGGKDLGERWTVHLDAGTGTTEVSEWTQQSNRESMTLPVAVASVEGWQFLGWTDTPVITTRISPATILRAGTVYQPEADVTLYALYGWCEEGGQLNDCRLVESPQNGVTYVLANKNAASTYATYALSAGNMEVENVQRVPGVQVEPDFSSGVPTIHQPTDDLLWFAKIENGTLTLSNGDYYLALVAGGLYTTKVPFRLSWDADYGLSSEKNGGNAYYIHTTSGKFTTSTSEQANNRIFLYEKCDFRDMDYTYDTYPGAPEGIEIVLSPEDDAPCYDLSGRRVKADSAPGVYLRQGKTIVR